MLQIRRRTWPNNEAVNPEQQLELLLEEGIANFPISVRAVNALEKLGVISLKDMLQMTPEQLVATENVGAKALRDIYRVFSELGLKPSERCAMVAASKKSLRAKRGEGQLSAAQTLNKLVGYLSVIWENLWAEQGEESVHVRNLAWAIRFAETRDSKMEPATKAGGKR